MPIYKAKLSDGRTVRLESDQEPTEDQILAAVEGYTAQKKEEFAAEKKSLQRQRILGEIRAGAANVGERALDVVQRMYPFDLPFRVTEDLSRGAQEAMGQEPRPLLSAPVISPEAARGLFGSEVGSDVSEGVKKLGAELISGSSTPVTGAALITGAGGAKLAPQAMETFTPLAARFFQLEGLRSLPHSIERLRHAETLPEQIAAGGQVALGAGGVPLIERALASKTTEIPPYSGRQVPIARGAPPPKGEPAAPIERATPEQKAAALEEGSEVVKGEPNAVQPESAPILRPVREQPVEGEGQVPVAGGRQENAPRGGETQLQPEAPKLPEEVAPAPAEAPKSPTSIKNAIVDQERSKRGLPPVMEPAKRTFGEVWDQATEKADKDPGYADRLVAELSDKPRAITDLEDATLLRRQVELQNEYNKAAEDFGAAVESGMPEAIAEQSSRVSDIGDRLLNLYNVNKLAGTETGRGLNARKMMANEDFTLAKMELDRRVANGGKPLTPSQRTQIIRLRERIAKTQKAFDDYTAKTSQRIAELEAQKTLPKLTKEAASEFPVDPRTKSLVDRVVGALEKEADAARERITERLGGLKFGAGPLHELPNIKDYAIIGAAHIARGAVDLGRFSAAMIREFGEGIKPHIESIFEAANKHLDYQATKAVSPKRADEAVRAVKSATDQQQKVMDTIKSEGISTKEVQKLAKVLISRGVKEMEPLVDAVHNALKEIDPNITRQEARDAIFLEGPKRPRVMDKNEQRLSYEAAKAKGDWHRLLVEDKMARRTRLIKSVSMAGELLNTSRAIITSADLSAVLRQGGFIALAHPIRAAKEFPAMFRAMGLTPKAGLAATKAAGAELFKGHPLRAALMATKTLGEYGRIAEHAVNMQILNDPMYGLSRRAGLYLSEHGHALSRMEEAYMSRWAEHIPIVAGSQRAYTTFLNKLRFDSFKKMAETLSKDGELTPAEAKALATFVNVATGRATFGKEGTGLGHAMTGMNQLFFAPRYVASRFQLLAGRPLYGGSMRTRAMIAGEYARFAIGLGVFYGLAKMAGATIETDPRSSDFGKVKFGNTRLDPLVGLQQIIRAGSQFATGKRKTAKGKIQDIEGYKPVVEFWRNKLAPLPGAAWDVRDIAVGRAKGKKPEVPPGHPTTYGGVGLNLITPMSPEDTYKALLDQGVDKGTAIALLSILGMGTQTYESK